jgi:hypothetical protein
MPESASGILKLLANDVRSLSPSIAEQLEAQADWAASKEAVPAASTKASATAAATLASGWPAGVWTGSIRNVTHELDDTMALTLWPNGEVLEGAVEFSGTLLRGKGDIVGSWDGPEVTLVSNGEGVRITWKGRRTGHTMVGTYRVDPTGEIGLWRVSLP